ncbi:MAG: amidohydrolase family protein [Pseudomonadota bacterium]
MTSHRKYLRRAISLLTVLAVSNVAMAESASSYITSAWMIDTLNGERIADPVIEVQGDRIISVEFGADVPSDAPVIDLGEATLLPGLADMHTHLNGYVTDFGYESLALANTDRAIRGVVNARKTLMAGFTAARNLGARGFADVALRKAIDEGAVPGPRLQVSGPSLSATGGHCDKKLLPVDYNDKAQGVADGPWALRAIVRRNFKYGADVIKICATGGVLSKGTDPGAQQFTDEELAAIVDEAHMLGMQVAAHAHGTVGILAAIRAGVDSVEHTSLIDDEGQRLAAKNGTFLSINAYTPRYMLARGAESGMLPESLEKARKLAVNRFDTYRRLIEEEARVVFGSDSGTYPHGHNARTFSMYVELGMTPMRAIQSATTVAAESLGWVGDTGAIAEGYYADIIAVPGNPLENINELQRVTFVMKGGEVYKN